MKKTSIILGASAAVLAIAGAFTTKGSNKLVANAKHFNSFGTCTNWTTPCSGGTLTNFSIAKTVNGLLTKCTRGRTLFTINTACINVLRTNQNKKP